MKKIRLSPKFWFYLISTTLLVGTIFIIFPPSEISFFIEDAKKAKKTEVKIFDRIDSSLYPIKEKQNNKEPEVKSTRINTKEIDKPTVLVASKNKKKITKEKKTKAKNKKTKAKNKKEKILTKNNKVLLTLVNSGGQTEINSIIYDDLEEEKEDNWQDIITDLQPVNIPTKADRILPREYLIFGTLLNKIVSLQSGFATFIADRNIYSKSGNNILIPTGSIGLLAYSGGGDERLVMEVIRITTPNNLTIVFQTKTNLSDAEGAAGVPGIVNRQYFRKYGLPLVFSLANNTINLASIKAIDEVFGKTNDERTNTAINNFNDDVQSQNNQIIQEILKDTLDKQTIITINAGSTITIRPTKDIFFQKPVDGKIYLKIDDTY